MNANEISKGIPHIEDLPVNEFIDVVKNLHLYEATEKVDGAQMLFGIDENGFYTSRESKGGKRIYSAEDYKISFPTTYMRSVHMLLETVLSDLKAAGLRPGDQVEAEVLYGELPNVVPYSADTNYLIFLRTTEGTVNIDRLKQKLIGESLSISLQSPFTADGRTIQLREETNVWKFSRSPKISIPKIRVMELPSLIEYLKEPSGIRNFSNAVILETPLNKTPEWCEAKDWKFVKGQLKERRLEIQEHCRILMYNIKEDLLNRVVHPRASEFGPLLEDGGWIEGIVLAKNGKMVKLVDKDRFGVIREDAWRVRNSLTERARSVDSNCGFLGKLQLEMAHATGHPYLGTMQGKKYLKESPDIQITNVKEYWLNLIESKVAQLERELDKYTVDCDHHPAVTKRTKETFASIFEYLDVLASKTKRAKDTQDFINILVGTD